MKPTLDRRRFLQVGGALAASLGWAPIRRAGAVEVGPGAPQATALGWRLGGHTYAFHRFTFFEAVDKCRALGLQVLEAFPGQRLSREWGEATLGETMSADARLAVQQKLAEAELRLVHYGVVRLSGDEAALRKTFEFAREMEIETLVSEPDPQDLSLLEKLCEEYRLKLALHNRPQPSRYWNPKTILEVLEGRSPRLGACADTGHWMRSGVKPLEAVQQLKGRILSFHLKDLDQFGRPEAHDVPWGSGQGELKPLLAEVYHHGFQGVFSLEYEHNWLHSLPEIAQCVAFFNQTAEELARTP